MENNKCGCEDTPLNKEIEENLKEDTWLWMW